MVEALCTYLECPVPEWIVIILAVIAMIMTTSWGLRYHRPSVLLVSAACANFAVAYLYIRLFAPSLYQRATVIRLATIYLFLSIIYFTARHEPRVTKVWRRLRGIRGRPNGDRGTTT